MEPAKGRHRRWRRGRGGHGWSSVRWTTGRKNVLSYCAEAGRRPGTVQDRLFFLLPSAHGDTDPRRARQPERQLGGQGGPRPGNGCCPPRAGFLPRGIRAVGVERILAEAPVTRATFYRHFPSKEDLVLAYLRGVDAQIRADAQATWTPRRPRPTRCGRSAPPSPTTWPGRGSAGARSSRPPRVPRPR